MLLTDKYADKIHGIITCYDRMIIQGYIPNWSHAEAMTAYMKLNGIRIFDYPTSFSQPLTEQVRQNAEKIAHENGMEIEFIRKLHAFRKDDRIQNIIAETGKTEGLIHIFSAMECCNTYRPWHDKTTGKTFLKFDQSKCLHYYFYFIDRELGLCYLRVPTWPPFRLQFYMNGHNLLAYKLDKKQLSYRMQDNTFLEISDIETAQKLSDRINPQGLHKVLDVFARRYSPVPESLGLGYTWTVQQIECATDIMFRKPEYLAPIYDEIIHTAIYTVKPDNIATFLGQRITYNCTKEIGTNYNQRILGTRIKHHMGDVSIKMYDKFGCVLRIESTCNDISTFRVEREVQHRDGTSDIRKAPLYQQIISNEVAEIKIKIKEQEEDQLAIEEKQSEIINAKNEVVAIQKEEENKRNELLALQREKKNTVIALEENSEKINGKIAEIEEHNKELEAELDRIINNVSGSNGSGGNLVTESGFLRPISGRITSNYGYRVNPVTGEYKLHKGIDYAGNYGDPIKASKSGVVEYSGWISGYGNTIILGHGNGVQTLYPHAQTLNVSVGEKVSQGDVIATVGSTGNSTGPHLHFEIRINGQPVDPLQYIPY